MVQKVEKFADLNGNALSIVSGDDGVTVSAHIATLSPYTGGADAAAARAYANLHGLKQCYT